MILRALVQITNTSRQSLLRSADSGSKHCVPDCKCSLILNAETSSNPSSSSGESVANLTFFP
jgi:hypothetical protein